MIENYFERIRTLLKNSPIIKTFELDTEKRTENLGFIRDNITFIVNLIKNEKVFGLKPYYLKLLAIPKLIESTILMDRGSIIREFVEVEISIDRGKYSYQYINQKGDLIFRYDNAPHHQKLNLSLFPHHKHDRYEDRVVISKAPFLEEVFQEIEQIINY